MIEIIEDTLLDILKVLPFLLVAFMIIEYTEHKLNHSSKSVIEKAGKLAPFIGSLLGAIPQCGFSVLSTNLYITRIISLGTLISVYLSTSDEMLVIMLAEKAPTNNILKIIIIKIIIGLISGFIIDLFVKKAKENYDICKSEHCHCSENFIMSAVKHTLKISLFILIITFVINLSFYYIGEESIKKIFVKGGLFTPFVSSLIGLIPNCGASVILTELYLNNVLTIGQVISGLLTNSGVALLVLFKTNKNLKENIKIIGLLFLIGSLCGLILEII